MEGIIKTIHWVTTPTPTPKLWWTTGLYKHRINSEDLKLIFAKVINSEDFSHHWRLLSLVYNSSRRERCRHLSQEESNQSSS